MRMIYIASLRVGSSYENQTTISYSSLCEVPVGVSYLRTPGIEKVVF